MKMVKMFWRVKMVFVGKMVKMFVVVGVRGCWGCGCSCGCGVVGVVVGVVVVGVRFRVGVVGVVVVVVIVGLLVLMGLWLGGELGIVFGG